MSERNKPIPLTVPAVVHIITDNASSFVSATLTRRETFSQLEHRQADWHMQVLAAGVTCHVLGRGPRIDQQRAIDMCEAVLRLNQALPQVKALTLPKRSIAEGGNADQDEAGHDFNADPVWQRIKEIAGGAR